MNHKTSIIICNWNTLNWLKRCVTSIRNNTESEDYELIIVDNGSQEEGTEQYILEVSDKSLFNPKNLGFAKGNNKGAKLADGDYLCFLNSDTIVTDGWLRTMIKTYDKYPKCGAVGPLGNAEFRKIDGRIHHYQQFIGQYKQDTNVNLLSGFCILIKSKIFNKFKWTVNFEYGLFEDNLLCEKMIKKGYELRVSANSYVIHPFPSRSFHNNNLDYEEITSRNKEIFTKKLQEIRNE